MIDLSGTWRLRAEHLDMTADRWIEVVSRKPGAFGFLKKEDTGRRMPLQEGFLEARVPGDVIEPLVDHGLLEEPLEKENARDVMWLDSLSWWYIRDFKVSRKDLRHEQVRLFIETLDYKADILINGRLAASHRNAFRPLDVDVKEYLQAGQNQIIVRLTGGYELHHPQDALTFYNNSAHGQRVYLRKPQFTHGWDWCKPVPTCGMGGAVKLEGRSGAVIASFSCATEQLDQAAAQMAFRYSLDNLSAHTADYAVIRGKVTRNGRTVHTWVQDAYLAGGLNHFTHRFTLKNPAVWWPNGSGDQPLYEVSLSVTCKGVRNHMPRKKIGVRTIRLDMDKLSDGTRKFDLVVNGRKIFMKGGNWVPADSVYLRIPQEKYVALVSEAAACNSNMLRVWGGGLYEPDCFYDACSELGILVMQDFMFACGFYPETPWFMHEVSLEADYQTKRLAHQACLALWAGNNEIHESYTDWYARPGMQPDKLGGAQIFNYLLPDIVNNNTPGVHYMPSSPFYGRKANDLLAGDCHIWSWTRADRPTGFKFFYELEAMDRIAQQVRFSSEYGFYGALKLSSVRRFHAGEPVVKGGPIWLYHGEHPGKRRMIDPSINNHLVDAGELDAEDYLRYAGIAQGLMYGELAMALRRQPQTSGHLIWMYNDCWPETGWSVIDYYLTRKTSFYFLKRAHQPCLMVLRELAGGSLSLVIANDSPLAMEATLECGHMDFHGNRAAVQELAVKVPAFSWQEYSLHGIQRQEEPGLYYALDRQTGDFTTSVRAYLRDLQLPEASIQVRSEPSGPDTLVTVTASAFVPVLEILTGDDRQKMSDNYFQLLPGLPRHIRITGLADNIRAVPLPLGYAPERVKSDDH